MRRTHAIAGGLLLALGAATACTRRAQPVEPPIASTTKSVDATAASFTGTASCSGRGCHGTITPSKNAVQLNEVTSFIWHDKHAQAFDALASPLAKQIMQRLGPTKDAQREAACLGCHVTPQAAALLADHASELARVEQRFGVGCESCHGSAVTWLDPHSEKGFKKADFPEFVDMTDSWQRAKSCLPCHVGAAPMKGIPARDVNHDLIAAGHPRLAFELSVYHDNLPPHGRRPPPKEASVTRAWALGQVATAEAALDLLDFRASPAAQRPWPEFAESDCFACHHNLQEPSWRQRQGSTGALAWGSWYFALVPSLQGEYGMKPTAELPQLRRLLGQPRPDVAKVLKETPAVRRDLGLLAERIRGDQTPEKTGRGLFKRFMKEDLAATSWDAAEQGLLACQALASVDLDPEIKNRLDAWTREMAAPASAFDPDELQARPIRKGPR